MRLLQSALFSLLLLVAGCFPKPDRPEALRGGTEHLLLMHDRVMRYQERHNGKLKSYDMYMFFSGGKITRVYQTRFKGADFGDCDFLSSGNQVFFSTTKPLTFYDRRPEYRQCWVNEGVQKGDSWEDDNTGTKTIFAGYESVTVPAGTYDNCYKTVTIVEPWLGDSLNAAYRRGDLSAGDVDRIRDNSQLTIVRWFASGVGLVKEQLGTSDYVRELVEIVQPGYGKVLADSLSAQQPSDKKE